MYLWHALKEYIQGKFWICSCIFAIRPKCTMDRRFLIQSNACSGAANIFPIYGYFRNYLAQEIEKFMVSNSHELIFGTVCGVILLIKIHIKNILLSCGINSVLFSGKVSTSCLVANNGGSVDGWMRVLARRCYLTQRKLLKNRSAAHSFTVYHTLSSETTTNQQNFSKNSDWSYYNFRHVYIFCALCALRSMCTV